MKIQIIGKVTNLRRVDAIRKFFKDEAKLLSQGHEVVNPLKLVPPHTSHPEAMRMCLRELLTVDAIAIQPDWYDSEGAKVEYMVANALQLKEIRL